MRYADANAGDNNSAVESVNLTLTGPTTGSVRVVTSAWDAAAGQPGVRVPLMSLLGFNRVDVGAAATAIFGSPWSFGGGLALTIGTCEFYTATDPALGGGYGSEHPATLIFKDPNKDPEGPCPADPAGKDAPGAFGWLTTVDKNHCQTPPLTVGGLAAADPGYSPSKGCKKDPPPVDADYMLPIYSAVTGHGNNVRYTVAGFASYHLMGYSFPNWGEFGDTCSEGPGHQVGCITGYFTTDTLYTFDGELGGPNFGVVVVKLTE